MKKQMTGFICSLLIGTMTVTSLGAGSLEVQAGQTVTAQAEQVPAGLTGITSMDQLNELNSLSLGNTTHEGFFTGDFASKYYYRDDYFLKDSREYNNSLSTMSLILACSAFNTYPYKTGYSNAETVLKDCGFKDIEANDGYQKKPETNSIGVIVAHKDIVNSDGNPTSLIALAVRAAATKPSGAATAP